MRNNHTRRTLAAVAEALDEHGFGDLAPAVRAAHDVADFDDVDLDPGTGELAHRLIREIMAWRRYYAEQGDSYGEAISDPDGWEYEIDIDGTTYRLVIEEVTS